MFCSIKNLSNLSGYFAANQNGTVTFVNIGCLSNDDREGNENVPSYHNECALFFFFNFTHVCRKVESYQYISDKPIV